MGNGEITSCALVDHSAVVCSLILLVGFSSQSEILIILPIFCSFEISSLKRKNGMIGLHLSL